MAEAHTKRVGLVLASIHTGASNGLWSDIAHLAEKSDISLFVFPGGRLECKQSQEYLRNSIYPLVRAPNLDGVIAWASALGGSVEMEEIDTLLKEFSALPCVTIGRKLQDWPEVRFDAYSGIQAVLLHCITRHGAKKIAFLRGPEYHSSATERYQAYVQTLSQKGLPIDEKLVSDPHSWNEGVSALKQLIETRGLVPGKDFDTLSCSSDLMMFDAGKYLQNLGIDIPRTVRLVGYNDSSESHLLKASSTTARMPMKQMATVCWDMMKSMLCDRSFTSFDILLPSEPVIRRSCGCLYSLGDENQARIAIGTKPSFLAWVSSIFHAKVNMEEVFELASQPLKETRFMTQLEHLVYRFLNNGGEAELLSEALHWYCAFFATAEFLSYQESKLRDMFLRQRDLVAHEHAYALSEQGKHLNELKYELLTLRNLASVSAVLEKHLPSLGIHSCFLVLCQDDAYSVLVGGYEPNQAIKENKRFPKYMLLPKHLQDNLAKGVYVTEPLFMDSQPLGYLVVGTSLFSGSVLEELRTALSSALKGAFLLESANQAKGEAEQAQRSMTEFFSNISEGLRPSLERILTLAHDLDPQVQHQIFEQVDGATHLLDLTLSYTGELELEKKIIDADSMVKELVSSLGWVYRGPSELPALYADQLRLKQALGVLASSVFKDGRIFLHAAMTFRGLLLQFSSPELEQTSLGQLEPSLSLAQRILLMHGAQLNLVDNLVNLTLPWPSLAGDAIEMADEKALYLALETEVDVPQEFSDFAEVRFIKAASLAIKDLDMLETGVLLWNVHHPNAESQVILYRLTQNPRLSRLPLVCLGCSPGYDNLASALGSAYQGREKGASVIVVGQAGEHLAAKLVGREKIIVATGETLANLCHKKHPSLVISDHPNAEVYEEIRKEGPTPIILLRETWSEEEISSLSGIPRLIIAHACVEDSPEFLSRLVALLGGSEFLPPLTGVLVKRAVQFIGDHISEQISRWQLSEAVNVSEDYLTRIFSKELGISPWDYLNRLRICLATALLKQTSLTINEVATQTGFQDQAYFCRVFRKFKGCPPTKVRQGS